MCERFLCTQKRESTNGDRSRANRMRWSKLHGESDSTAGRHVRFIHKTTRLRHAPTAVEEGSKIAQ